MTTKAQIDAKIIKEKILDKNFLFLGNVVLTYPTARFLQSWQNREKRKTKGTACF